MTVQQAETDPVQGPSLLERIRRRDSSALAEIATAFGTELTRAAWLYLNDPHAAADVVQDTLLCAWDGARRTSDTTRLRSWLFGILFNRCRKHIRHLARRRRREERAAHRLDHGLVGDDHDEEQLAALRISLRELEPERREIIILRYEQGLNVAETAEALDIPEGTVKSRTHAALKRLRERMTGGTP